MSPTNHITQDDLTLLALQFLSEKEQAEAMAHIAGCEECSAEFGRIQGDLAGYAFGVDMHSPPAYARERLMRQISNEKKVVSIQRGASEQPGQYGVAYGSEGSHVGRWAWSGWAVAAALGLVSVLQYVQRQHADARNESQIQEMETQSARAQEVLQTLTDARARQVGLHLTTGEAGKATAKSPEAHAAYMADKGALVFFASKLEPLQPYKTYELWLLPANGHDPIAAGIFKPDANGNANVVMPNLPKGVPAAGFGVTIEDEGGSKQPTLPIMMSGT